MKAPAQLFADHDQWQDQLEEHGKNVFKLKLPDSYQKGSSRYGSRVIPQRMGDTDQSPPGKF